VLGSVSALVITGSKLDVLLLCKDYLLCNSLWYSIKVGSIYGCLAFFTLAIDSIQSYSLLFKLSTDSV
jgi:hypothetical protein